MPASIKCPICQTDVLASQGECPVCGARLPEVIPDDGAANGAANGAAAGERRRRQAPRFEMALGEDDLYAPHLARVPWVGLGLPMIVVGLLGLLVLVLAGSSLLGRTGSAGGVVSATPFGGGTAVPTFALGGATPQPGSGGTPMPTLFLPTLPPTPSPTATPSPTETPGPCEQIVGEGDTLIILATRCGHRSLDVLDAIVDLNGLRSPESLQIGQRILIPWPTPTPGPVPADESGGETQSRGSDVPTVAAGERDSEPTLVSAVIPSPTLQPGVMWYTVQLGDTIISVAVLFSANVEILSQLNPEVTFSQCDFGMDSGGSNCIVNLYEGQRLRVPAPSPTPTLSPTPSGSETPTPTPTPTFNAPSLLTPGDRALFGSAEIVTLRWVSTGVLAEGETFLVTVTDTTGGVVYTAATTATFFIVPALWQPADGQRHLFTWEVAVGPANGQGGLSAVTYTTDSRIFFWDSP